MFHVASYSSQYVRSPTLGLSKPSKICWFQMVLITKGASLHASTIIPPQRSDGKGANKSEECRQLAISCFSKTMSGVTLEVPMSVSFNFLLNSPELFDGNGYRSEQTWKTWNWKKSGRAQIKTGPAPALLRPRNFLWIFRSHASNLPEVLSGSKYRVVLPIPIIVHHQYINQNPPL